MIRKKPVTVNIIVDPQLKNMIDNWPQGGVMQEQAGQGVSATKQNVLSTLKPTDIMLDLETIGTHPGCGIIEIGYTLFSRERIYTEKELQEHSSYFCISLHDNLMHRMAYDTDTLEWWEMQQKGLPIYHSKTLQSALAQTAEQWNLFWRMGIKNVWCKPATFDVPILQEAMDTLQIERPMQLRKENFRHINCFATLRRVYLSMDRSAENNPLFNSNPVHSAIKDAQQQAAQASYILASMPKWHTVFASNDTTQEYIRGLKTDLEYKNNLLEHMRQEYSKLREKDAKRRSRRRR